MSRPDSDIHAESTSDSLLHEVQGIQTRNTDMKLTIFNKLVSSVTNDYNNCTTEASNPQRKFKKYKKDIGVTYAHEAL